VVPNKRILYDSAQVMASIKKKQGLGNQVQIPLFDSDRNGFYDLFDGMQDHIGDLIQLSAKIKQVDDKLYQ
jgi:hypothetical protein